MRIPPDGLPFPTMLITSCVLGAQPPLADPCLNSPFALHQTSKSGRCTVASMLHQPDCRHDATPPAQTYAPPQPLWPIQIP